MNREEFEDSGVDLPDEDDLKKLRDAVEILDNLEPQFPEGTVAKEDMEYTIGILNELIEVGS